jgi:hypothetical protein
MKLPKNATKTPMKIQILMRTQMIWRNYQQRIPMMILMKTHLIEIHFVLFLWICLSYRKSLIQLIRLLNYFQMMKKKKKKKKSRILLIMIQKMRIWNLIHPTMMMMIYNLFLRMTLVDFRSLIFRKKQPPLGHLFLIYQRKQRQLIDHLHLS